MVYKRRYKKRQYKKKSYKVYKKKRYIYKKKSKYGNYLNWKCEVTQQLTYEGNSGAGDCTVNWLTINNPVTDGAYIKPNDSSEFVNFRDMFRYYRIKGLKIRWQPITAITSAASSFMKTAQIASFEGETGINNYTTDTAFRSALDYKQFDPSRPYTKYINVAKHQMNVYGAKWIRTGSYSTSEACTAIRVFTTGYSDETQIGSVTATYYVQFRQLSV